MNAIDELNKVIKYWEEGKSNPSTAKLTISGDVLKEIRTELAALQSRLDAAEALVTKWRDVKSSGTFYTNPRQCAQELEAALQPQQEQEA